jgi:hypothetical protein
MVFSSAMKKRQTADLFFLWKQQLHGHQKQLEYENGL